MTWVPSFDNKFLFDHRSFYLFAFELSFRKEFLGKLATFLHQHIIHERVVSWYLEELTDLHKLIVMVLHAFNAKGARQSFDLGDR